MRRYLLATAFAIASLPAMSAADSKDDDKVVLDKRFIVKSATCSHAEVAYSKVAEKRGHSEKVRDFASKVVKEHNRLNEDVTLLAEKHKIAILTGTEQKTKDQTDRLSKLEGADFDRAYLKLMIADHEKAVRMYDAQVKDGREKSVSSFAKKALPHIKAHLKEARALQSSLNDK